MNETFQKFMVDKMIDHNFLIEKCDIFVEDMGGHIIRKDDICDIYCKSFFDCLSESETKEIMNEYLAQMRTDK